MKLPPNNFYSADFSNIPIMHRKKIKIIVKPKFSSCMVVFIRHALSLLIIKYMQYVYTYVYVTVFVETDLMWAQILKFIFACRRKAQSCTIQRH